MTITEVKYYYYRDKKKSPRITVCRVRLDNGVYSYGWSICTEASPHREIILEPHPSLDKAGFVLRRGGRAIARGRAVVALTAKRGVPCRVGPDGIICRFFHRPIHRPEALAVVHACHAGSLLQFLDERDVRWLPNSLRPIPSPSVSLLPPPTNTLSEQKALYILAGADANELEHLEMLTERSLSDGEVMVYSEGLERFVPQNEAL